MEIAGKPVLQHILDRLSGLVPRHQIILATSDLPSDNILQAFAEERGIACERGSLAKVGERFYAAARRLNCDYAIRMNGDNIFLDPSILGSMIEKAISGSYQFLSNVKGRSFPKGMSVEIVNLDYYERFLPQIKVDEYCNEHVMVCLYQDPKPVEHYYLHNAILPAAAGIQLALDTVEDFERSRWMLNQMPAEKYDLNTTFEYYLKYERSFEG